MVGLLGVRDSRVLSYPGVSRIQGGRLKVCRYSPAKCAKPELTGPGGKSDQLVVEVLGMGTGQTAVAGDRVPMHAHEPLGLADAVALGDVVQDRGDGLLGQAGAEQRGALALGEASLARVAVEQSELLLFAVVAADREVFSAPSALVWAVGIQAAEP